MLRSYIKLALKVLLRRKFFTAISLFCIAFTLVVLMVVTAIFDHLFAPMAPEVHAARSLRCNFMDMRGDRGRWTGDPGYGFLDRYVRTLPGAEAVTVFSERTSAVTYLGERKLVSELRRTDGAYWRVLRFEFLEGGPFGDSDDRDGNNVAVLNASTRRRYFGDDATAVGRSVELDDQTFRVVGVVKDVPGYRETAFADVWVPLGTQQSQLDRTSLMGNCGAIVLARDRADLPRLRDAFVTMLPQVEMPDPKNFHTMRGILRSYPEARIMNMVPSNSDPTQTRTRLFVLLVAAGALLFMWLPAMNLVNINLSRILERSSEIGVRKAFGASSWTLVAQFVLENVVLCLVGGALALGAAWLALRAVEAGGFFPYAQLTLNLRIFAIGLALAVFFGVLSGVYPAWRMSRMHPVVALRGGVS